MNIRLVLFFTRGVSLKTWNDVGMFDREVAIYRRLQEHGVRIAFVTYGNTKDLGYAERIPGIRILCNRWRWPQKLYERLLPFLYRQELAQATVYKTNQTNGADVALRAAKFWRKPLVARCGYMWSEFAARQQGVDSRAYQQAIQIETTVFSAAPRVVVTTPAMQQDVAQRIPVAAHRTVVIPNYSDTTVFRPLNNGQPQEKIVFVGRLSPQKNVSALLEAIQPLDVQLMIIGNGELRSELQGRFATVNGRVTWQGNVPNSELPPFLNQATLFVLPSHYEGHPKALIEAMACGLPVIGANSAGIRELIEHGETGWLCDPNPAALRVAIQKVLADKKLRERMGRQARKFVCTNFSLDRIFELELTLLEEVVGKRKN